jgi:hypothetical protein
MKNQTVWLIGGAIVLYYLYTKSQAASAAAAASTAASNQTGDYIDEGLGLANELF